MLQDRPLSFLLLSPIPLGLPPGGDGRVHPRSTASASLRCSRVSSMMTLSANLEGSSWCGFGGHVADAWRKKFLCPGIHDCPSGFLESSMASVILICWCQNLPILRVSGTDNSSESDPNQSPRISPGAALGLGSPGQKRGHRVSKDEDHSKRIEVDLTSRKLQMWKNPDIRNRH